MMEKDPKFSSIPPSAMLRWASQWDRERTAVWRNLDPIVEPGEFIPFGRLWAWKIEKSAR